jgi:hypothetical protein
MARLRYWFEQLQSGRVLTGVELEWAEAYRDRSADRHSRDHHWRRAAALGSAEAALRIAEQMPCDDNFELAARVAGARHANRLGELELRCERLDDARKWFRLAAESGDTDAMKLLASELETDLKEAWTWVHLAELLGVNVMECHAVGEHGLPADSDEAGPIYAAGGFELDQLPDVVDEPNIVLASSTKRSVHDGMSSSGAALSFRCPWSWIRAREDLCLDSARSMTRLPMARSSDPGPYPRPDWIGTSRSPHRSG